MKPIFPARFELQPEGGYLVQFIDLPEVMTEGATLEEAELNAQEALSGILEYRLDQNQDIPDRGGKGSHRNFSHPACTKPVTLSGSPGQDAKPYQERQVQAAIEESKK